MGSGRGSAGRRPRCEVIWKRNALLNRTAQDDFRFLFFVGDSMDCPGRTLQLLSLFSVLGLWSHKPLWNFRWKY